MRESNKNKGRWKMENPNERNEIAPGKEIKGIEIGRDSRGRFQPGHQISRHNKSCKIDKDALLRAMKKVEMIRKEPFLEHVFNVAYENPAVLNKLLDKFFADLSFAELKAEGTGPLNVYITQYIEKKEDAKKVIDIEGESKE